MQSGGSSTNITCSSEVAELSIGILFEIWIAHTLVALRLRCATLRANGPAGGGSFPVRAERSPQGGVEA